MVSGRVCATVICVVGLAGGVDCRNASGLFGSEHEGMSGGDGHPDGARDGNGSDTGGHDGSEEEDGGRSGDGDPGVHGDTGGDGDSGGDVDSSGDGDPGVHGDTGGDGDWNGDGDPGGSGDTGEDGDSGGGSDLVGLCGKDPTTFDEYIECHISYWCWVLVKCYLLGEFHDRDECLAMVDAWTLGRYPARLEDARRAYAAGRVEVDRSLFAECLRELSPERCAIVFDRPACVTWLVGKLPDGASCYSAYECASPGARCERNCSDDACCAGTCVPAPKLGEDCGEVVPVDLAPGLSAGSCEPGLRCDTVCVAGDLDDTCSDTFGCDRQYWCDGGVCVPDLSANSPCRSLSACGGNTLCVGLLSSQVEAQCLRVSEPGDACDMYCWGNLYCDMSQPNPLGVCRALPGPGEDCLASGLRCSGLNYRCGSSGCQLRKAEGQPCSAGECLMGLYCTSTVGDSDPRCAEQLPADSPCIQDRQCESHLCARDENQAGTCFDWSDSCSL